jgi:hypothetical protein
MIFKGRNKNIKINFIFLFPSPPPPLNNHQFIILWDFFPNNTTTTTITTTTTNIYRHIWVTGKKICNVSLDVVKRVSKL